MRENWLNIFFHFSGKIFQLKQSVIKSAKWYVVLYYALLLFFVELFLAIISLPLYLLVAPKHIQKGGLYSVAGPKTLVQEYVWRRRIGLTTSFGAVAIFLIKVVLVGGISFYLFGAQKLLADTQNWTFGTPTDYTYNTTTLEITGGMAQLKDIGGTTSSSTVNSGFATSAVGWTGADWTDPANVVVSENIQASGGNTGPYVDVNIAITGSNTQNRNGAGYWQQRFVTNVATPDTATLNLDWKSISYTSATAPDTYRLYAFIETATGAPGATSTAVWNSGEIRATSAWASIVAVNIASKIPTAGTYYLKIAAYATSHRATGSYAFISGFDNVIVNWSKTTHTYSTAKPTTTPVSSLTAPLIFNWNGFTETATKNGGEITYQLSSDDGATWKFWNGSAWATAGATNSSTATVVNANIASFVTSTHQIKWRSFFVSDGSQQVKLSSIAISYTQNNPPQITGLVAAQDAGTGNVHVDYNLQDADSDPQSLVNFEYSLTGAFSGEQVTMAASTTDSAHSGITSLGSSPAGTAHTFAWDARSQLGSIVTSTVFVRLRANDGIANSGFVTSSVFSIDYLAPTVSNVSALQTTSTTMVSISYDLSDNTSSSLNVELQISGDGGSTWDVPVTSASGNVGSGQTSGTGKIITWNADTDFSGHSLTNAQVRVRARDSWSNQGSYAGSINFSLDTLAPVVNSATDLQAQPNAGDTTVLIGGSFTETNPNTNNFYVAVDSSDYGSATTGNADTATPAAQNTIVASTLKGNSYISKVKIVHTDDYGQTVANENIAPATAFKYVKPYTPPAPVVNNPGENQVDVQISKNTNEADGLEYAIFETSQSLYVQADGSLSGSAIWQQIGTGAGQWGEALGVDGKIAVIGLSSPVAQYSFAVKSRNTADLSYAATSESALSSAAGISNTAASISIIDASQSAGNSYALIHYTGSDAQNDANNLVAFEYSTDNTNWFTMTEKSGVGSSGTGPLSFTSGGASFVFAWDVVANLSDFESSVVRIRLKSNDGLLDSNLAESSAFTVDTKAPVISNINAVQSVGSGVFNFTYDLTDSSAVSNTIQAQISDDNGATWSVPVTSIAGDLGDNVSVGVSRSITWNANTDYSNSENANFKIKIKATDRFSNASSFVESALFTVDTKAPVVSAVTTTISSTNQVVVSYNLADITATSNTVEFQISNDNGSTWNIATATYGGDVGANQTVGTKTFTWNAPVDFAGQASTQMKIQVRAGDYFGNVGDFVTSESFALDTAAPVISNLTAAQITNSTTVQFNYDLADTQPAVSIVAQISSDGGNNWSIATTTLSGDFGASVSIGSGRIITWQAGTDFGGQESNTVRVRLRATDSYGNVGAFFESADFSVDTLPEPEPPAPEVVQPAATGGGVAFPETGEIADIIPPDPPLIFSPAPNSVIYEAAPTIIGGTEPGAVISIILDGENKFIAQADADGAWRFILPSQFALTDGRHSFTLSSVDLAGNESGTTSFDLTKAIAPVVEQQLVPVVGGTIGAGAGESGAVVQSPLTIPTRTTAVSQPTPSAALVQQSVGAIQVASLLVPKISTTTPTTDGGNFVFSGTALPNQDVLVYVHSSQALIYRTHSDSKGQWQVTHSQQVTELAPGDHTIFAVSIDPTNKVKSRPSAVSTFSVKKNFWVSMFTLLNLETTAITLAMLGFVMVWLYRLRVKVGVEV